MNWTELHNIYDKTVDMKETQTTTSNVQRQPPTKYFDSIRSQFEKGTINPLEKRIITSHLNIDTRFRKNYNMYYL